VNVQQRVDDEVTREADCLQNVGEFDCEQQRLVALLIAASASEHIIIIIIIYFLKEVASLRGGPPLVTPSSGVTHDESLTKLWLDFTKDTGNTIIWKAVTRVELVTITKKVKYRQYFDEKIG